MEQSPKNKNAIGDLLTVILSDGMVLYTKTRKFHWNVSGNSFMELHILFENQYKQLEASIDEIAERIVKIALQNKTLGVINCCSGKPVKLKDFVNDFLNKNGYKIKLNLGVFPYADYEPMETWGDVTKLDNILNTK